MIIAKRFAFMGASISHGALLGISLGLALVKDNGAHAAIFFITLLITLISVAPLALATFRQRLPNDAIIGLFFTGTMGLGLIINQVWGQGKGDLMGYLFGNILTLGTFDFWLLLFLCALIFPIVFLRRLTWMHYLFDEESLSIQGVKTAHYHVLLFFMLTLVIVSGLKLSGVILINSFLLTPGIFALKMAPNARSSFNYSIYFALITTFIGFLLAHAFDLPTGATLAVVQVLCYFLSFLKSR